MFVLSVYNISVNLITNKNCIVFLTDFCNFDKFFFCPYTSYRIVWVTDQHDSYSWICYFLLKIFKIHLITAIFEYQIIAFNKTSCTFDYDAECMVNRSLDQHFIARTGICIQDHP